MENEQSHIIMIPRKVPNEAQLEQIKANMYVYSFWNKQL